MISFSFPTDISFGPGVISQLAAYLKTKNIRAPLLVTDGIIKDLPFYKKIVNQLSQAGISIEVFSEINMNPVKSNVLLGKAAFKNQRDGLIGIGGGAALDVARAIALSINHHRDLFGFNGIRNFSSTILKD